MSLQLPAILSPPTSCIPTLALTVLAASAVAGVASPLLGSASGSGLRLSLAGSPMHQAVSCSTWFCLWTGSSPPVALHPALSGDAVTFDYGQPVLCPMGTFTPLLVRTLRRTRDALPRIRGNMRPNCEMLGERQGSRPSPERFRIRVNLRREGY